MDRREAEKIYTAGKEAVIDALCRMQEGIGALESQVKSLTETVAKLSKNSLTSYKAPSSDIVKSNKKKLKPGSKRKKGGQPGHVKHERVTFSWEEKNIVYTMRKKHLGFLAKNREKIISHKGLISTA